MRVVALLSWYEESPLWLAETIESLTLAGVDHLVALDGAYALYPDATPTSRPDQSITIAQACERHGIEHTIRAPTELWESEIEKRSALFELGEQVSRPKDWFFVVDADEVIQTVPGDFRERLQRSDRDVGRVTFLEPREVTGPARNYRWQNKPRYTIRCLFRAQRGIRVEQNHWTYITADGKKLWGQNKRTLEPCLDCSDLELWHRTDQRESGRRADQFVYYDRRDREKVEVGRCDRCGAKAIKNMPTKWEPGEEGLTADFIGVCATCEPVVKAENDETLLRYDINPKTLMPLPKLVA